jgi:hypothetical protein
MGPAVIHRQLLSWQEKKMKMKKNGGIMAAKPPNDPSGDMAMKGVDEATHSSVAA